MAATIAAHVQKVRNRQAGVERGAAMQQIVQPKLSKRIVIIVERERMAMLLRWLFRPSKPKPKSLRLLLQNNPQLGRGTLRLWRPRSGLKALRIFIRGFLETM